MPQHNHYHKQLHINNCHYLYKLLTCNIFNYLLPLLHSNKLYLYFFSEKQYPSKHISEIHKIIIEI